MTKHADCLSKRKWRTSIVLQNYISGHRSNIAGPNGHPPWSLQFAYTQHALMQHALQHSPLGTPLKRYGFKKKIRGKKRHQRDIDNTISRIANSLHDFTRQLANHMQAQGDTEAATNCLARSTYYLSQDFRVGNNGIVLSFENLTHHSEDLKEVALSFPKRSEDNPDIFEPCFPSSYGICDSPEQLLAFPQTQQPGLIIAFSHIAKDNNAPRYCGWRWEHYGPYVGTGRPRHEYLNMEHGFDNGVWAYTIYSFKQHPAIKV